VRRVPVLATAVVALAVAAMLGLGLWQLTVRLPEKEAYIAQLRGNPARPPVAFPRMPDDRLLFRRTSAMCLQPVSITRAGAGKAGFRLIAACRTGAEGPGFKVQLGTTRDPNFTTRWPGGQVSGWVSHAPSSTPLIAGLFGGGGPQEMLLVSDRPAPGLAANTQPTADLVPNNHLSYAVQWFFFAAIALVIYAVALRARVRAQGSGRG
jgi:surfeit locus 1 family protein